MLFAQHAVVLTSLELGKTMLPIEPSTGTSANRRVEPQVKLPSASALRELSADDAKRLKQLLGEPIEYMQHDWLDHPAADTLFGDPYADLDMVRDRASKSDDSGIYGLDAHEDDPLDSLDPEHYLFLKLNYHRRELYELVREYDGKRLNMQTVAELLRREAVVHAIRSEIIRENMPLVLAMAKRTRIRGVDPADLISEGSLALMRASNKFDCARGYKFSTYACRAILKSFSRVATRTSNYRGRFPVEFDPALEKSTHLERRRKEVKEACVDELRSILNGKKSSLSDVERKVIQARFALDNPGADAANKGKTLEQVGEMIGVTKERVRQIQNKALDKLRVALDETVLA